MCLLKYRLSKALHLKVRATETPKDGRKVRPNVGTNPEPDLPSHGVEALARPPEPSPQPVRMGNPHANVAPVLEQGEAWGLFMGVLSPTNNGGHSDDFHVDRGP